MLVEDESIMLQTLESQIVQQKLTTKEKVSLQEFQQSKANNGNRRVTYQEPVSKELGNEQKTEKGKGKGKKSKKSKQTE